MRKLTIVAAAIALSGCMYQTVDQSDIQTAVKACGSLENIVHIEATAFGAEVALCTDREIQYLNSDVWAGRQAR